jgi:hypothetical protein
MSDPAKQLNEEVELFRRVTQSEIRPDLPVMGQVFDAFCGKIEKCRNGFLKLSERGLPAWFILCEFFRYECTLRALAGGDTRKFKTHRYWKQTVEQAEVLLKSTRNIPQFVVGSNLVYAAWQSTLEEWVRFVRSSYLLDENYYIFYSVPPSGYHFVCQGYKRKDKRKQGSTRGRTRKPPDEDLTYLAVVLQGCIRIITGRATGLAMDKEIADVLCAFFEFTSGAPEYRINTLRSRIDYFRDYHGKREIKKLCGVVLSEAQRRFQTSVTSQNT